MNNTYDLNDLISFGNYLLSEERRNTLKQAKNVPINDKIKQVHDSDIDNWNNK